jgi:small subunit ribosomal protein S20
VANIKSQIKRVKTNNKAQARNKSVSSSVKTAVRKFRDAVVKGDAAATTTELRAASKALDIAVAKGVVHSNTAANKKSSMAKAAAKAGAR